MIFNETTTWIGLLTTALPGLVGIYFFLIRDQKRVGLVLLLLSAFLIRLLMISLDPFLHEWDERFHALVAKNMIANPFRPMLFTNHIMAYDFRDWSYNHIWLNKQPLFLWQMALSMKIFGTNEIALRLPSVIMSTIFVWLVYDIGRKWLKDDKISFVAASFATFQYYVLELITGRNSLDHNDIAFLFYITCSIWAFVRYIDKPHWKWPILIGIFVGLAILNKWLAGMLIFGGWGLYILIDQKTRNQNKSYIHLLGSLLIACTIFLPWQFYIHHRFPDESGFVQQFNNMHFIDAMGHPGSAWYHVHFFPNIYNFGILVFFLTGIFFLLKSKDIDKGLSIAMIAMIIVIYLFFSILVKTRMPSYVLPVASIIHLIAAYGLYRVTELMCRKRTLPIQYRATFLLTCIVSILLFKPWNIAKERSLFNDSRNKKIHNAAIFKNLDTERLNGRVILNTRSFENIELMFYQDMTAYHFFPDSIVLDSLQLHGHKFAVFDYTDIQEISEYIKSDTSILILEEKLK